MAINIIEFKAKIKDSSKIELLLKSMNPVYHGEDRQVDTYFNVQKGRLKLREGNIENALIWYDRPNEKGTKLSQVSLYKHSPDASLKNLLIAAHGVKVVVDKLRRIYFIENVKFHFDNVRELGTFIEVEAIDETGSLGVKKIQEQCDYYAQLFALQPQDYVAVSYSDLLLDSH